MSVYNWSESTFSGLFDMQPKTSMQDPLHGITLKTILTRLEDKYGWQELGQRINIKCFTHSPNMKSSLSFLRKTLWARQKVEQLYLQSSWPAE